MKKTTFLIVGKHAVLEALKNPSRKIERVFVTEDAKKKLNRENQSVDLFKNLSVEYLTTVELLTRDLVLKSGEILKVTAADANKLHVVASIQEFTKVKN